MKKTDSDPLADFSCSAVPLNEVQVDDLRRWIDQDALIIAYGSGTRRLAHYWVEDLASKMIELSIQYETLSIGFKGKPSIANRRFEFNLSHTQHSFLIGFSKIRELGVDLELSFPSENLADLTDYAFSKEERMIHRQHDDRISFLRIWTLKEAYLKATGIGLLDNLSSFNIASPAFEVLDMDYSSFQFCCPGGEIASVVYKGTATKIHCIKIGQ